MDVEMNKIIWNLEWGFWEYFFLFFGIEKKGLVGFIFVFGNYLVFSFGLMCVIIYCL